jgi:hypothetical protein
VGLRFELNDPNPEIRQQKESNTNPLNISRLSPLRDKSFWITRQACLVEDA